MTEVMQKVLHYQTPNMCFLHILLLHVCVSVLYGCKLNLCVLVGQNNTLEDTWWTLNDSVISALNRSSLRYIFSQCAGSHRNLWSENVSKRQCFLQSCALTPAVWIRKTRSNSTLNNVHFYFNVLRLTFWCSSSLLQVVVCFNFWQFHWYRLLLSHHSMFYYMFCGFGWVYTFHFEP